MAASAGMAEAGHGSSVMESELEAPMPRSPPVNGGVSEWEKTPLHDSFSAKTVEKVARVITDKVLAEQELMMDGELNDVTCSDSLTSSSGRLCRDPLASDVHARHPSTLSSSEPTPALSTPQCV